ncbi:MAG: PKD domain-containing protein [Bacteroidia bacterium]|nr:PKD domain-containing protein [Bacteroidia bacterium]
MKTNCTKPLKHLLLVTALMFTFFSDVKAQCHAAFTYVVNPYTKTVSFTSTSTGSSLSYLWKFGSGSNLTVANPVKTYTTFGTYTVCLYVSSGGACYDSICTSVTINNPCNADFTYTSDTVNYPKVLHFYPSNTGSNLTYLWTFGDSSTTTTTSPIHTYTNSANYYVCLRVTKAYNGDTCTTTLCKYIPVGITSNCHAVFTYVVNPYTKVVTFTNTSTGTGSVYNWTFGDASASTAASPTKTYSTYGTFNVCLRKGTGISFCDSICTTITLTNPCNANFTYSADSLNSKLIHFYAGSGGTNALYLWNFGDSTTSTVAYPTHTFANNGLYSVCLRVTKFTNSDTCVSQVCYGVPIGPVACRAAFTYSVNQTTKTVTFTNTSAGTGLFYNWKFGDNTTSSLLNPSHTYTASGTYTVCLRVYNSSACIDSFCSSVIVNPTSACYTSFTAIPDSVNKRLVHFNALNTGTNLNYFWTFGDSTTSALRNPDHLYSSLGTYTACLRITKAVNGDTCNTQSCSSFSLTNNCNSFFSGTVDPNNNKKITFGPSAINASNLSFYWTFGDSSSSAAYNPSHTYATSGMYTVCFRVIKGGPDTCSSQKCLNFVAGNYVLCNAQFIFVRDTTNALKLHFGNTSIGDSLITTWNFGDGTGNSTSRNPDHIYAKAGTYYVCMNITRNNPACSSYKCDSVTVGSSAGSCDARFNGLVNANTKTVAFANSSTGSRLKYAWSFGDSTTSTLKNPMHVYAHAGTYAVCLYVFDSMNINCNSLKCLNFGVPPVSNCTAAFAQERDTAFHTGIKYNFTSATGYTATAAFFLWTFGDGDTSHAKNPDHVYAAPGSYAACLNVVRLADSCNVTHCQVISVAAGVGELANELQSAKFYPNPFDEHLTLELNSLKTGKLSIVIYDLTGRTHYTNEVMLDRNLSRVEIETQDFPKGVYLIKLGTNGDNFYRKLVK